VPNKAYLVAVGLALLGGFACASEDPKLERRGGPLPPGPVIDEAVGGHVGSDGAGGAGTEGGGPATAIAFCEAFQVIRAKCQRCHNDPTVNGAPVPFLSYEDTQAQYYMTDLKWSDVMVGMVENDFMPFVALNDSPDLVGGTVEPLTADEKATLLGWLKQGALPEGGTDCPE